MTKEGSADREPRCRRTAPVRPDSSAGSIDDGKVIPFLGAGANLCDRPAGTELGRRAAGICPAAAELSRHLAQRQRVPGARRPRPRARRAVRRPRHRRRGRAVQPAAQVFSGSYEPNRLHQPPRRAAGPPPRRGRQRDLPADRHDELRRLPRARVRGRRRAGRRRLLRRRAWRARPLRAPRSAAARRETIPKHTDYAGWTSSSAR